MRSLFGVRSRVTIAVAVMVALVLSVLAGAFLASIEADVTTGVVASSEENLDDAERRANERHIAFVDDLRLFVEESWNQRDNYDREIADWEEAQQQELDNYEREIAEAREDYKRQIAEVQENYERQIAEWEDERRDALANGERVPPRPPEPQDLPEPEELPEPPELAEPAEAPEPPELAELDLFGAVGGSQLRVYDATGRMFGHQGELSSLLVDVQPDDIAGDDTMLSVCRRSSARVSCTADGEDGSSGARELLDIVEALVRETSDSQGSDFPGAVVGRVVSIAGDRLIVVVNEGVEEERSTADDLAPVVAIALLAMFIGAITWFALGRTLDPVKAMIDEVDHIGDRNLDHRITVPRANDELQQLAHTMNRMLDRLLDSRNRQRRFVSDASHELRSPITAVQATLEVAMANPDDADWRQVAGVVNEENSRLGSLVDDLLLLARLDEDPDAEVMMAVDLDEVCLVEAERSRKVPVHVQVHSPARVNGSLSMLTRAVRNLIDNAAEHAKTTVDVEVVAIEKQDGAWQALVSVSDDGPGILPEDRAVVFERFTRLDEARSRSVGGGAGLGLAIVAGIAEAYGGEVTVQESPTNGARFVLSLPIIS